MSLIISPNIKLVVSTEDVTTFNYNIDKSTRIGIVKNSINVTGSDLITNFSRGGISTTADKTIKSKKVGKTPITFSFSTYMKPTVNPSGNTVASDYLLFEALSNTTTNTSAGLAINRFISISSGNRFPELYFYLIFDDNNYIKINKGVVSSLEMDGTLSGMLKNTWTISATSFEIFTTSNLGTNYFDASKGSPLRNKLSFINFSSSTINYSLALAAFSVKIKNTQVAIQRKRLGELSLATGFYVDNRTVDVPCTFLLHNGVNESTDLLQSILLENTLDTANIYNNIDITIGTGLPKVKVNIPKGLIKLENTEFGVSNSMSVVILPQESTPGVGDDIEFYFYT